MNKDKEWFMNIEDKIIIISQNRFCPPHYLPHKLPFGKRICNEHCHIHRAKWRMKHHSFFCKMLKCPNFVFMIKKHEEFEKYMKE